MVAHGTAIEHGVPKAGDAAVDRNGGTRSQALVGGPDNDLRPDGIGLRGQQANGRDPNR